MKKVALCFRSACSLMTHVHFLCDLVLIFTPLSSMSAALSVSSCVASFLSFRCLLSCMKRSDSVDYIVCLSKHNMRERVTKEHLCLFSTELHAEREMFQASSSLNNSFYSIFVSLLVTKSNKQPKGRRRRREMTWSYKARNPIYLNSH
jgi:hypothetical protein